jgi:hypothetical protein
MGMCIADQPIDQRWIDERAIGSNANDRRCISFTNRGRESSQRVALRAEKGSHIGREQWSDYITQGRVSDDEHLIDTHRFGHSACDPFEERLVSELPRRQRVSHRGVGKRRDFDNAESM